MSSEVSDVWRIIPCILMDFVDILNPQVLEVNKKFNEILSLDCSSSTFACKVKCKSLQE
jgi:hypothetical protein